MIEVEVRQDHVANIVRGNVGISQRIQKEATVAVMSGVEQRPTVFQLEERHRAIPQPSPVGDSWYPGEQDP